MPLKKQVKVEVTPLFNKVAAAEAGTVISVGGAGSSKSYTYAQFFTFKRSLVIPKHKLLILRKTRKSLKMSLYADFMEMLEGYGLYSCDRHNKSDLIYTHPNGSQVVFTGLDNREKIKSTQWHDIWLEEATDFSLYDYIFLNTRKYRGLLQGGLKARIWMSLNPVASWIQDLEGKPDTDFIYSTVDDNPYANDEYIKTLDALQSQDETFYNIYRRGLWSACKNTVYPLWDIVTDAGTRGETVYGLDFGYNNPTALIRVNEQDLVFTVSETLHKSLMTMDDIHDMMMATIPADERRHLIYADCAEPDRIEDLRRRGWNIRPAYKGPHSVKDGIDFVKRFKVQVTADSPNIMSENKLYKWREDTDGNLLEEPVKFKDHTMDAIRYAIYTHWKRLLKITDIKQLVKLNASVSKLTAVDAEYFD